MARRPARPARKARSPKRSVPAKTRRARPAAAAPPTPKKLALHVLNGGTVLPLWKKAGIRAEPLVHAEAWLQGPVAPDLRAVLPQRLAWLRANVPMPAGAEVPDIEGFYQRLSGLASGDDVVLWGEDDLFCLVNLLGALSLVTPEAALVSVVWSPQRVTRLDAGEVGDLAAAARRLGPADQSILRRLWDDYASGQRDAVAGWIGDPRLEKILPGADALLRLHLGRFPSAATGLGADETFLVSRVVDGDQDVGALLRAIQADPAASRYGLGDWEVGLLLRALAHRKHPLIRLEGDPSEVGRLTVRATAEARPALLGKRKRTVVTGIDRWIGGVHLSDQPSAPKGRR